MAISVWSLSDTKSSHVVDSRSARSQSGIMPPLRVDLIDPSILDPSSEDNSLTYWGPDALRIKGRSRWLDPDDGQREVEFIFQGKLNGRARLVQFREVSERGRPGGVEVTWIRDSYVQIAAT